MINLKFTKTQDAVYISHIDILRSLNKTLRRADIEVNYSQGFNPHMLLNLSQPLPIGIRSLAEWVSIDTPVKDAKKVMSLYNSVCPSGFEAVRSVYTEKAKNIAGNVSASEYFIECKYAYAIRDKILAVNKNPYTLNYTSRGKAETKEVSGLIYSVGVDEAGIRLMLAFGNINLRIDKLFMQFNTDFGLNIDYSDITRLDQYVKIGEKFIEAGEYLLL